MAFGNVNVPGVSGVEFTAHTDDKNNPHTVTKSQIGLGNVDNTADADKPISTATQAALNQKANTSHTHTATDITLDSSHRFVTDSEKSTWNGKANSSHGTHVEYDEGIPCVNGVGSAGTRTMVSRSDHIHPTDTSRAPITSPTFTGVLTVGSLKSNTTSNDCCAIGQQNVLSSAQSCLVQGNGNTTKGAFGSAILGHENHIENNACLAVGYKLRSTGWNGVITCGECNVDIGGGDSKIVAGGGTAEAHANIFRAARDGVYSLGSYHTSGADYAEFFEWKDGNAKKEDRRGLFVTLDGAYIRIAESDTDYILGVISGAPSVVGDVCDDQWCKIYERDVFGQILKAPMTFPKQYTDITKTDENGNVTHEKVLIRDEYTEMRPKVNPNYRADIPYEKRSERPEWDAVGLLGKLVMIDDGTGKPNEYVKPAEGGIATASDTRTKYRVMERLDENHIRILIL